MLAGSGLLPYSLLIICFESLFQQFISFLFLGKIHWPGKYKKSGMGYHTVRRPKVVRLCFIKAHHDLTYIHKSEFFLPQSL